MGENGISLTELLIRRRRNNRLTKLFDQGRLPFHPRQGEPCSDCGESKEIGQPREMIEIDDHDGTELVLCEACFKARFHTGPTEHVPRYGYGNLNPATPRSEEQYNGGDLRGIW